MHYKLRDQPQIDKHPLTSERRSKLHHRHQQVNPGVNQDQPLHPARERRQAERDSASSIHRHGGASITARGESNRSNMGSGCAIFILRKRSYRREGPARAPPCVPFFATQYSRVWVSTSTAPAPA